MPLISDKYFYSLRHSGSQILTNVGTPVGSRRRIYLKLARHAIAQKAVNMMYGEIDGHAHYLQTAYSIPKKVISGGRWQTEASVTTNKEVQSIYFQKGKKSC